MLLRVPASMRTRPSLSDLIEGRLSSPDARAELVRLATRLIVEDAFKDETGRLLLSRTAVSEIGERLWADYQEFATRDLASTTSSICSSTASPSVSGRGRSANRCWPPGASPPPAPRRTPRPHAKDLGQCRPNQIIQHFSNLTAAEGMQFPWW